MTSGVREHNWAVLRFLENAGQVPTIPVFRGSTLPRPPATPTHHATIYSAFLNIMADMWRGLWSNLCQSGRTSHFNHPTESIVPFRDDPVPITQLPDIPYEANRDSVFLRTQEEVKPHLKLLNAYVRSCPIDTHDKVGFMVIEPLPEEEDCERCYSAMLPPIILRWVQFRAEVESIHRETRQGMFAELLFASNILTRPEVEPNCTWSPEAQPRERKKIKCRKGAHMIQTATRLCQGINHTLTASRTGFESPQPNGSGKGIHFFLANEARRCVSGSG
ncbi:hypothetical protein B0H13DRAFT_1866669 [Mycena leptocephala]|nr:hypothetical protein B0H13DRAFT_1866669 [Mycena leptocephala]